MKICKIEGCNKEGRAEGLCWSHHNRLRRYGDPLGGRPDYSKLGYKDRFMMYVDKKENGCWEWTGGTTQGYGRFGFHGKSVAAHRVSMMLFHEPYAEFKDLLVCHKCDNTMCVNPDHLFLGTHQDNINDKMAKGRHNTGRGMDYKHAKITDDDVLAIRASQEATAVLAFRYDISTSNVNAIRSGKRWKHVGGLTKQIEGHPEGDNHPMAKLTEEKVRYIRNSDKSTRELAEELGISKMSVYEARKRKTWKHVI